MCRMPALAATLLVLSPAIALAQPPAAPGAPQLSAPAPAAKVSAEQRALADRADPVTRAAFWNEQVRLDETDVQAGIKLARALRDLGRYGEAAEAARRAAFYDPANVEAHLEVGRAKIAEGQAFYGIENLRIAKSLAPRDWRAVSLLGVAYEQVSRPDDALAAYEEALALSPDNPAVLSNLGMFHAQRGDAARAETYLRRAAAQPGSTVQIRQNLAFVLGVQGKLPEAERLLREDLPPELANNNLAYLRALNTPTVPAAQAPTRTYESLLGGG